MTYAHKTTWGDMIFIIDMKYIIEIGLKFFFA